MTREEATAPSTLRVHDLGLIAIERDHSETVLSGKAATALLLLTSRFPGAVPRQVLFDVLWGEDAPSDVANSLRVLVHRLRKLLGGPELLSYSNESYRLTLSPTQLDSVLFTRLLDQAGNHLADGRPDDASRALDSALALWRGPASTDETHTELNRLFGYEVG